MSLKEYLCKEAQKERKKWKEMPKKDRLWYIWEYYKFHIAVVLGVIGVLAVIGTSIYNKTFETSLYCIVINNYTDQEMNFDTLNKDFREHMGFGKKQQIFTEALYISYGDAASEYSYASMAKISALIISKDLDIIICDKENFDHYTEMNGFLDLEQVLPADMTEALKDRFCYAVNSSGQTAAVGIDLSGTDFAQKTGITLEPAYCGLITNTQRTDTCIALLRYIFDL